MTKTPPTEVSPSQLGHLDFLSEETRKRCKIFEIEPEHEHDYSLVNSEHFHDLYEIKGIDFSLYVRVDNFLIEFIKPEEFKRDRLNQIWTAMQRQGRFLGMYIRSSARAKLDRALTELRERKIDAVLAKEPSLDKRVLTSFTSLTHVSNMIVRGGISSETADLVTASTANMVSNIMSNRSAITTLSRMATHDPTLYDHSASMSMICAVIAAHCLETPLPQRQVEELARAALYHDVGKTMIPGNVLNKPGKLTPEEFSVIKTHVTLGVEELTQSMRDGANIDPIAVTIALEHHERMGGHGYPSGKKGRLEDDVVNGIHLYSRIAMIADVYSALLMQRVYKPAYDAVEALKIMIDIAARDYDPLIFNRFAAHVATSLNAYQTKSKSGGRIIVVDESGVTIKSE